jgi:hypothetical protein
MMPLFSGRISLPPQNGSQTHPKHAQGQGVVQYSFNVDSLGCLIIPLPHHLMNQILNV